MNHILQTTLNTYKQTNKNKTKQKKLSCYEKFLINKMNIEPSTNTRIIELHLLPNVCSMSLKELCRRAILRCVDSKLLNKLPLPPKMITYLSFNNYTNYDIKTNTIDLNNNNTAISAPSSRSNNQNLKLKLKKKVKTKNKFCFITSKIANTLK